MKYKAPAANVTVMSTIERMSKGNHDSHLVDCWEGTLGVPGPLSVAEAVGPNKAVTGHFDCLDCAVMQPSGIFHGSDHTTLASSVSAAKRRY
jgi:hypothetical protein